MTLKGAHRTPTSAAIRLVATRVENRGHIGRAAHRVPRPACPFAVGLANRWNGTSSSTRAASTCRSSASAARRNATTPRRRMSRRRTVPTKRSVAPQLPNCQRAMCRSTPAGQSLVPRNNSSGCNYLNHYYPFASSGIRWTWTPAQHHDPPCGIVDDDPSSSTTCRADATRRSSVWALPTLPTCQ